MRRLVVVGVVLMAAAGSAAAMFMLRPEAPVDRLLKNVTRKLEKAPDDPHLLYLAGRAHALAYAQGETAPARSAARDEKVDDETLPVFDTMDSDRLRFSGEIDDVRLAHLQSGIRLLRRAAELAKEPPPGSHAGDERGLVHLGLAWLLDDGGRFAVKAGSPSVPEPKDPPAEAELAEIDARIAALGAEKEDERKSAAVALRRSLGRCWPRLLANRDAKDQRVRTAVAALLTRWWRDRALDAYRRAFALSKDGDLGFYLSGMFDISGEAGEAILRLLDDPLDKNAAEKESAEVRAHLDKLATRGMAVTPVLFPASRVRPLADLLPAGRTSAFDVAGDGVARRWPWPSADAAFLVWRPDAERSIESGRQLFGSRTWWIFWRDGYEPLSMLDDDDDGRLSGAELDGICVWRDLDGDGRSAAAEVWTAAEYGLSWIAVRATRTEDGVPAADAGIGLTDGTTRPTFDWTPTSVPYAHGTTEPVASSDRVDWTPTSLPAAPADEPIARR